LQALTREVKEEISVELIPASIKYTGIFKAQADGKNSALDFYPNLGVLHNV
jgi:8-oxo-dGTP diphosphatase